MRPLGIAGGDFARRPLNAIFGAPSHIAILRALSTTTAGLSGRAVARAAGIAQQAAMDGLARLEAAGVVKRTAVGQTYSFRLNGRHRLVKEVVVPALEGEARFREGVREAIRRRVPRQVATVAVYGSVARREDTCESDLDLLVVVRNRRDTQAVQSWLGEIFAGLGDEFGVRLSPVVVGAAELARGCRTGESFYRNVMKDAEVLHGTSLGEVVRGAEE